MSYLLDTNVVSEWTRPQPDRNVLAWLADVNENDTYLSVTTFAELRTGIELMVPGRRRTQLETWVAFDLTARFSGRILVIDRAVADAWGVIGVRRKRAGIPIGPLDAFFAATAEVHGLTLVTRNVRHFASLGVAVFDPWTYAP